jgi:NAD(P)-dependent dehydrogenase (short-subunit alcohol dehydrogenase family)
VTCGGARAIWCARTRIRSPASPLRPRRTSRSTPSSPRRFLVNLAGIASQATLHECALEEFHRVMAVEVTGSHLVPQGGGCSDSPAVAWAGSGIPLGRVGQPAEITATVAFPLSEGAAYINGSPRGGRSQAHALVVHRTA